MLLSAVRVGAEVRTDDVTQMGLMADSSVLLNMSLRSEDRDFTVACFRCACIYVRYQPLAVIVLLDESAVVNLGKPLWYGGRRARRVMGFSETFRRAFGDCKRCAVEGSYGK